ncbi:hypothetical protein [Streptomyces sp. ITFR-6]|uniref:hypothetical protein n=1 Tax=Streptomyces sp. ITFR-6 TaxID=3075197 RepID=UPI002888F970|nr:hypothetical protein [Streptomyces sp. ITFR-6]WNI34461.1 hypothetical protein RLT59_38250 [Streptomyces sp. ITFR-6]
MDDLYASAERESGAVTSYPRPTVLDGARESSAPSGHAGSATTTSAGHAWPPRTQDVRRYGTLIRLIGLFTDEDLTTVRDSLPGRQVTRDGEVITVWPAATRHVAAHHDGLVILRGSAFDTWSVGALRASHPSQFVSHDGDTVTIWPVTVDPTQLRR